MEKKGILGNDVIGGFDMTIDYCFQKVQLPFCSIQPGPVPRITRVQEVVDRPEWLSNEMDGHSVFRPVLGLCTVVEPCKMRSNRKASLPERN